MRIGLLGAFVSLTSMITAANANIDTRKLNDPGEKPLMPKYLDPREFRLPPFQIEQGPPPVQAADTPKVDPKARLIQALELQIPSLKKNVIDKGSFSKEIKENLDILHKAGEKYIANKGNVIETAKALGQMEKALKKLPTNLNPGARLIIAIQYTVSDLRDLEELKKLGPKRKD